MSIQPLIDFHRSQYCECDPPHCAHCAAAHRGRDCAGVDVDPARQRQPTLTRDAEIARIAWRGRRGKALPG